MVALFEFFPLNVLVGEGLDHADACQRVLEAGVHIPDLPSVFHKCFLHPAVLPEGEDEHAEHESNQRQGKPPVDQEKENKGAYDLYQ